MSRRILVVDDEEEFATALARRLGLRGYAARAFTSAAAAIAHARNEPPDVILLDLKLPGTSPIEMLMTIRQEIPGVRVVLLTGHLDHELRLEGMRLDAFPYVMKPVVMEELLAKIEGAAAAGRPGR